MLESHPRLKKFLHYLLIHPYTARPRWWARTFVIPLVIKRGERLHYPQKGPVGHHSF